MACRVALSHKACTGMFEGSGLCYLVEVEEEGDGERR